MYTSLVINKIHCQAALISGDLEQTFSGCYEKIQSENSTHKEAFGFIYRKDTKTDGQIDTKTIIDIKMNYKALVFVSDRLSLPNSWIM